MRTAAQSADQSLPKLLREEMARELAAPGATKKSALRLAIVALVQAGHLRPGTLIPAETALAESLGISVGTVQAALGQLADMGMVERRRGDGTRVSDGDALSASIWHFRFIHRSCGSPFRQMETAIEVMQTTARGPWVGHLGEQEEYTMIRRAITDRGNVTVGAEMVLNAAMLPPGAISASELRSTNIRTVLEARLDVKVKRVDHTVTAAPIDARKAGLLGLAFKTNCLHLEARTYLSTGEPFYFQHIYAPAEQLSLSF